MTLGDASEPTSTDLDHALRIAFATYSQTVRQLVGCLSLAGLEFVRRELRTGIWKAADVPESHRPQHAVLLHDVTERLASASPSMRGYYESAGDLLPAAPDDASGLVP